MHSVWSVFSWEEILNCRKGRSFSKRWRTSCVRMQIYILNWSLNPHHLLCIKRMRRPGMRIVYWSAFPWCGPPNQWSTLLLLDWWYMTWACWGVGVIHWGNANTNHWGQLAEHGALQTNWLNLYGKSHQTKLLYISVIQSFTHWWW